MVQLLNLYISRAKVNDSSLHQTKLTSRSPPLLGLAVYAVGVWYGLLSMAGFKTATVNAMHWKHDLGLKGLDKNDSRLLAQQLIPTKAEVLE